MARKRYAAEQIISMLRTAEIVVGKGQPIRVVVKKLGITDRTYRPLAQGVRRSAD